MEIRIKNIVLLILLQIISFIAGTFVYYINEEPSIILLMLLFIAFNQIIVYWLFSAKLRKENK